MKTTAEILHLFRAWTGKYVKVSEDGVFTCVVCGSKLFKTDAKFESGSGECLISTQHTPAVAIFKLCTCLHNSAYEVLSCCAMLLHSWSVHAPLLTAHYLHIPPLHLYPLSLLSSLSLPPISSFPHSLLNRVAVLLRSRCKGTGVQGCRRFARNETD